MNDEQFKAYRERYERGDLGIEDLFRDFELMRQNWGNERSKVEYAFAILKEFDNYGSDSLDTCVREVATVASELRQQVGELQFRGSTMQNELRMWKARANAKQKLLDALLLLWSNRWGFDGDDAIAQDLIRQVSKRNDDLEADAWSNAVNEVRAFVKDVELMLDSPEKTIQRWTDRFKTLLSRA